MTQSALGGESPPTIEVPRSLRQDKHQLATYNQGLNGWGDFSRKKALCPWWRERLVYIYVLVYPVGSLLPLGLFLYSVVMILQCLLYLLPFDLD